MRIALSHVNTYLINGLYRSGAIAEVLHNGLDIILAALPTGESVAVHLVERDIDEMEVWNVLKRNTAANRHTLFILWAAMLLPDDGTVYRPNDWMRALLTVYEAKIYGYEVEGADTFVFPVHFDAPENGIAQYVHWGDRVNLSKVYCRSIYVEGSPGRGTWQIASFEAARQRTDEPGPSDPLAAFYQTLGVDLGATWETIHKAYRDLARQYHPDVNLTPEATEQMQRINTAYQRLRERFEAQS